MSLPTLPINQIVADYKTAFDWLHQATSRTIIIITTPIQSGCLNHSGYDPVTKSAQRFYNSGNPFSTGTTVIPSLNFSGILNIPFPDGATCPVCEGAGFLYSPSSGTALARIQWRNESTKTSLDHMKLVSTNFKVRIKVTGQADIGMLDRAERVIIDGQNCRKVKEKVPVGLRDIHSYYYYLDDLQ